MIIEREDPVMAVRLVLGRSVMVLVAVTTTATLAGSARADGGLFSGTQGARATGRGGAFTARADDLSAVMLNPAGLAHIEGTLIHVGNRFSYNAQAFTRAPTTDYGSPDASGGFPIHRFDTASNQLPLQALDPILGVASDLGLDTWTFALAVQAPPGVARQSFPIEGGQRYMMVDYEVLMLNTSLSAAYKPSAQLGLGASVQWIHVPSLEYSLVVNGNPFAGGANPVSSNLDMLARLTGSAAFTLNTVVGAWYRPVPSLELGVAGQVIPTQLEAESRLDITPVSPDPGTDDTVILSRGDDETPGNDVTLTIPLPLVARAGIRYRHLQPDQTELFDVELDAVYETWSRVDRFTVDTNGLYAEYQGDRRPLGDISVDKQWRDTIGIHLGGEYALIPNEFAVRAGVFYQTALVDPAYANVDFVTGAQLGGSLGASVFWQKHEIAFAYEYRREETISLGEAKSRVYQTMPLSPCMAPYTDTRNCSPYYLGRPGPPVNAGTYDAFSHLLVVDWLYRF
ncbi:MAG: outer membrane protein transport protein [Polyangiaceae bacterium]|nr:outer membrane protein transport protein [Polyangiaceae bacterium]